MVKSHMLLGKLLFTRHSILSIQTPNLHIIIHPNCEIGDECFKIHMLRN